ncbi:U-scoloptoxin(11)-Sm5a-like [Eriocheir sinensis]|uniref:U-scoloptoxin(11)-Sm5a-like n=1 Tax=Eriocheir sinensis TaxID=95602 RepID=UPI0021C887FA|nr:U-scoloptoxin(11)-Sm5a-like [Eriocheir sinensis]XP_050711513.1 U-scoloptoxin(11)-Sm5a-like [Eriocheir sinensis]XP_050711514.1 U-scoloptoxin(11)-Sm5a-like [Eriocheir sinensis]XP_050711515.1 U-scoloptoxin(11)-Sm5a-like [Eriocheir sinensis]
MTGYTVRGKTMMVSKVTMIMTLLLMTLGMAATSSDSSSVPNGPLRHLLKGTFVLYANGRRSERDMPECSSKTEACNLAHRRYWITPVTERLCRCSDRSECPLHFTDLHDPLSQHVSNRAQFKFCGPIMESLPQCKEGEIALKMLIIERKSQLPYESSNSPEGRDTHSTLLCRCPWPRSWSLANITTTDPSSSEKVSFYKCQKLPKCRRGDQCGYIREDTLETYYSCSCPEHHLCVFMGPQKPTVTSMLHYQGNVYTGHCTPH